MSSSGRIFMLDDDGIILDLYKELFEAKGYEFFATTNAYKLLLYAKEVKPDIFILDVNMPGMSGWEVLQKLRSDEDLKKIPVLMLSVSRDIDLAVAKGAAHFLNKPLDMDKLSDIVEAYCVGGKQHDILLLEDFDAVGSFFEKSIYTHHLQSFNVHGLWAAKRYLEKNMPKMVFVCYPELDFNEVRRELAHNRIYKVDSRQDIEEFLLPA